MDSGPERSLRPSWPPPRHEAAVAADAAPTGLPDRVTDPVVLTGADVPGLEGVQPDSIVAFRLRRALAADPRAGRRAGGVDYKAVRQIDRVGAFSHEAYTDPGTFAGADPDPTLDDGDEIAMMAKDAGGRRGCSSEPGRGRRRDADAGRDRRPARSGSERFIYLFETDSGLDPAAGKSYVDYDFSLDSGDYKTTYDFDGVADDGAGALRRNPEDSTVTTPLLLAALLAR